MSLSALSAKCLRRQCLRSARIGIQIRHGSGHHGPNVPPFAQLRPPSTMLPEEVELVWDDGVAPETCIDFDASFVSSSEIFSMFFGAFGLVGLVFGFCQVVDSLHVNPVAPRSAVIPPNTVQLFLGLNVSDSVGNHDDGDDDNDEDDDE